jgi:NADPH:quinone reductase-like Zn-dependent oxidoreductase
MSSVSKKLGADVVLDRSKVDVFAMDAKYDLIFDTPAKHSAFQFFQLSNSKGSYVATLPGLSLVAAMCLSWFYGKSASFVQCAPKRIDLELVGGWLANGLVVAEVDSTYPIRDLKKALLHHGDKLKGWSSYH